MSTDKKNDKRIKKEDETMNVAAIKVDNTFFNDFLKLNMTKINSITPKNPSISKDDQWVKETFWDEDYKELQDK